LLDSYHAERHAAGERLLCDTRAQVLLGDESWEPVRRLFADVLGVPAARTYLAERVTGVRIRYPMPVAGGDGTHPWLGRMAPDLPLIVEPESTAGGADETGGAGDGTGRASDGTGSGGDGTGSGGDGIGGTTSLTRLLWPGRPVLLDLAVRPDLRAAAAAWQPRLAIHTARCARYPDVAALLLRPDGHVAWIAGTDPTANTATNAATNTAPDSDPGPTGNPGAGSGSGAIAALRHALRTWFGAPVAPERSGHATGPAGTRGAGR
jgi:hypothetical protein